MAYPSAGVGAAAGPDRGPAPLRGGPQHSGRRQRPAEQAGHQFEAVVTDRIANTCDPHQILTEQQITQVLGAQTKRGDAIIGHAGDYLLVEVSTQSLRRTAAGDPAEIASKCEAYHHEADQAEAVARRLGELVRAHGLPGVRSWTYLVVTGQALPSSPALAAALRRIRPNRTPWFVCNVEEFEARTDSR